MGSAISFIIQRPVTKGDRLFLRRELEKTELNITEKQLQAGSSIKLSNTKAGRVLEHRLRDRFNS